MKRTFIRTSAFLSSAGRLLRKQPEIAEDFHMTLELLAVDPFDPLLKTHKLKGKFGGTWACSLGYDLRLVFEFVRHEGKEAVLLMTVGTRDEVY